MAKYSKSQKEATARYDAKTYKKVLFTLRLDEDKDIIEDLEIAHKKGLKSREWLRELFENYKK